MKDFFSLTPERVLDAVEAAGLPCTGRCLALNSFENRVYDVEVEDAQGDRTRRVVKFYRPGRWSRAQVLEEHVFLKDLAEAEIPVVVPRAFADGDTLRALSVEGGEILFGVFPKAGGRAPDELSGEALEQVGRLLGRLHQVGASRAAGARLRLDVAAFMEGPLRLLEEDFLPPETKGRYGDAARGLIAGARAALARLETRTPFTRIHGDCHLGNLLWTQAGACFVDFDDMVVGPAVQDLWLLAPGRDAEAEEARERLLVGYRQFRDFDSQALREIEWLRGLRLIHYSGWLARRWEDPAFKAAFPQFGSAAYWREECQALETTLHLAGRASGQGGAV